MIKIEAKTLHEAYEKASAILECSVTMLDIEIIQNPSSGFLGLFSKQAIIVATQKPHVAAKEPASQPRKVEPKATKPSTTVEKPKQHKPQAAKSVRQERKAFSNMRDEIITPNSMVTPQEDYEDEFDDDFGVSTPKTSNYSKEEIKASIARQENQEASIKRVKADTFGHDLVDDFFQEDANTAQIVQDITHDINKLFKKSCFNIEPIKVSMYDEKSVLVEFSGEDAALLIGKEGYRYKALSYMLFNWLNAKYDLQLRLEIAQFLQNQEEMIRKYLVGVVNQVNDEGRAQTKILDGVLVQIALKELRTTFPNKYVAIRTNRDGLKYIIINSFRNNA